MNRQYKTKWMLHNLKKDIIFLYGFNKNLINFYDEDLIKKLRNIYNGALPASILLLSNFMSNGKCYESALMLSKAFLDSEDDVKLIYASIDSIKLNPINQFDFNPLYADHCFVERITKDGKDLIYDTSKGLIYDKKMYWLMEKPKIRKITSKEEIINYISKNNNPLDDIKSDKRNSLLLIPLIEDTYEYPNEIYARLDGGLLQREVNIFKKSINYNELDQDIKSNILIK